MKGGEQAFLDWLQRTASPAPGLRVAIGDDAAVIEPEPGQDWVVTTDAIAEGTHFLRTDPPRLVGRKALAVCLSDVAAMGARPRFAFVSAVLPRAFPAALPRGITLGMRALGRRYGVVLAGGDTNSHRGGLVLAVTVVGSVRHGRAVTRSGAKAGDVVAVTGALGGSFSRGRHLRFEPRLREAGALVTLGPPHAMMDVSDGLLLDLWRLTRMSGVGARVFADRVPVHRDAGRDPARALDRALSEGEDFELLFTMDPSTFSRVRARWRLPVRLTQVGEIVPRGFTIVRGGVERKAVPRGFEHR